MSARRVLNTFGAMALWLAILATAIGCVYARHSARTKFVELRALEQQRDELEIELKGLQLTEDYLSRYDAVEQRARESGMQMPDTSDIAVISP